MKIAHQIKIKVFSYEKNNEDEKLILDKFLQLFPFNLEYEKVNLKKTYAEGFHGTKITIFEVTLVKERHTNQFIENLTKNLDAEQKKLILSQIESRLDNHLDLFLRFDKKEYLENNKLMLTDSGNCFHMKISIAAFPKNRELGLNLVKYIFS